MRRCVLLSTLLALLGLLLPAGLPGAVAQSPQPGGVGIVPAEGSPYANGPTLLVRDVRPGAVVRDRAVLVNTSSNSVRVAVYPADGLPAQGGGFGYTSRGEPVEEVGRWLSVLGPAEVDLPAGARVPVALQLSLGADAFDGRNVGAVVVEPLDQPTSGQFSTRTRYAMPVTVVVVGGRPRPSPVPSASSPQDGPAEQADGAQLRDLQPRADGGRLCPTVLLGNPGRFSGTATLRAEVDGPLGARQQQSRTFPLPPPATTQRVELPCLRRPVGPSRLHVVVEDERVRPGVSRDLFWVPWPFYVSLLLLLLLVLALATTWLRGMLRRRGGSAERADA